MANLQYSSDCEADVSIFVILSIVINILHYRAYLSSVDSLGDPCEHGVHAVAELVDNLLFVHDFGDVHGKTIGQWRQCGGHHNWTLDPHHMDKIHSLAEGKEHKRHLD
jgi:hypothetical protein